MIKQALYFAYGSNLNQQQMKMRCPKAEPLGPATLKNHRLVFRHVADIEAAPGKETSGALWLITQECLDALDRYEGYPNLYTRYWTDVETENGETRQAIIYKMASTDYASPSPGYLGAIAAGYRDFNLCTDALDEALTATKQAPWQRRMKITAKGAVIV